MPTQPKPKIVKPHRREGGIPKLSGNKFPQEFLFIDTETHIHNKPNNKVEFPLRLGVAIYVKINPDHTIKKRTVLRFNTTTDFLTILKTYATGRKTIYVFAHNIKFDIMVLNLPYAASDVSITSGFPIINARMFIWRLNINKAKALLIDTANYGVLSVELLGLDLGYEKLEVDFDHVSDEDLLRYCIRDVEILEKFMLSYIQFIHVNNLGSFRMTLASQSLAAWRTRFMHKTVNIHNNEQALALERKAYHGGRTEAYYIGTASEQPYYYLDVNSMYPYVMKSAVVPIEHLYNVNEPTLDKFYKYVLAHYVIADVEVTTTTPAYPLVFDNKLVFPTGTFRTVLHHKELSYAVYKGDITKCYSLSLYKYANIFGYYVDFFYDLKRQAKADNNTSWYLFAKLMMNSLYGKMAQTGVIQEIIKGDYERIIQRFEGHTLYDTDYQQEINWFGTIIRESRQGESSYSFPACAGAITANARMLLWSYIECAGLSNTFYCDTDSLIVNQQGYNNLKSVLDNQELGMLKLEHFSNYLEISGAKDYEFGNIVRHKGVSPKALQQTRNKWKMLQFDGILPWFSAGTDIPASARYLIKERKVKYNKGRVNETTGIVKPLKLAYNGEENVLLPELDQQVC